MRMRKNRGWYVLTFDSRGAYNTHTWAPDKEQARKLARKYRAEGRFSKVEIVSGRSFARTPATR